MSELRRGLQRIPEHMHESVIAWVERAEPHPLLLGSFLRAVLCNDLKAAAAYADDSNQRKLFEWAMFLYNDVPSLAWGDEQKLLAWHAAHHAAPPVSPAPEPADSTTDEVPW